MTYTSIYGSMTGRGEVEAHVLSTLSTWIVYYVAEFERRYGLPARSTPVPPAPESIHGGIDFETFESGLMPEIIVVIQPVGEIERYPDMGYGQWYSVSVGALVYSEGDQDRTRQLADLYGDALQLLMIQQGAFGLADDGTDFSTRTLLHTAASVAFPDSNVRDVLRATVVAYAFIVGLGNEYDGPRVPPLDPYAEPEGNMVANRVIIDVVKNPDAIGPTSAEAVIVDGTVHPPVVTHTDVLIDAKEHS